jgi:hypothetical protein
MVSDFVSSLVNHLRRHAKKGARDFQIDRMFNGFENPAPPFSLGETIALLVRARLASWHRSRYPCCSLCPQCDTRVVKDV